jgi:hypothetical protein
MPSIAEMSYEGLAVEVRANSTSPMMKKRKRDREYISMGTKGGMDDGDGVPNQRFGR